MININRFSIVKIFTVFIFLFVFPNVLQFASPPVSLNWDEVKITIRKNMGIGYSNNDIDYAQVKSDLVEASKSVKNPESNPAVWARLRGYSLLWIADHMELAEFVERQKYQQATKGLQPR